MIHDLGAMAGEARERVCDVLVVGGGIAGLLLATRLSRLGRHVIIAESGARSQPAETHPLNEVVQLGTVYSGATAGRFRCLGGTSSRWGGAMLPFMAEDIAQPVPGWDVRWPISLTDFTAYQHEVEALFDLPGSPYEAPQIMAARDGSESTFVPRLGKWPAFKQRNVASLLNREIAARNGPEIYLNATVTRFELDPAGRLVAVEAQGGRARLRVRARNTVLAAGAIESTRLLLLADRQHDDRIFAPDGVLGRYFHDHLSAPTARLTVTDRKALNRVTGFRFEGRAMRNLRFEPTGKLRAAHGLPAAFGHIGLSTQAPTGFDALRTFYRKLQRGERPATGDAAALAVALPWITRAAWWRYVEKRLLFPDGAKFDLHMVVEQEPHAGNRIGLSHDQRDVFGCPLATIEWRVGEGDVANAVAVTRHFRAAWNASSLARLASIEALPADMVGEMMSAGGGIYHPGGTVRMGIDARSGVVDSNLRTFRIPNLSVVSTATFPSGGGANPTMMLMMAALRAADQLGRHAA
ncbi:GMC family oxidoreductase [Vineibacter terrae]|uniref:GMC family oxidoreductase n=1 Tax=Vineibacter terrae TaxID=2586908 RepID=A0A5C8PFK8_9HYPH|nr:GMC family oxidoreductase [Vineibacter terrae]TXL72294.1 GMC family oxidoreductase [Vineibacter terrae]